jgi:GNAT superfamily N-acetyltransferase
VTHTTTLDLVAELSDADRTALQALTRAIYPPDEAANWPGRAIEWSAHDWCVRVHDDAGALVCYAGLCLREGELDGKPARIGGIGGVKTDPAARRRGLAARAMERSAEFFRESDVTFALLVCEPRLLAYYGRLGWREFAGRLLVRQREATVPFTFNRVMTCAVTTPAPEVGTIDLLGPPW